MDELPFRKVTAIVSEPVLVKVEEALMAIGVPGMSVMRVEGYGEYANFFRRPPLVRHMRVEIFAARDQASAIIDAIHSAASTGMPGDGIIAVLPVEQLWSIRSRAPVAPSAR